MAAENAFRRRVYNDLRKRFPGIWLTKITVSYTGVPDTLCCYRRLFIAIELKAENGRATPKQLLTLSLIALTGGFTLVAKPSTWAHDLERLEAWIASHDITSQGASGPD